MFDDAGNHFERESSEVSPWIGSQDTWTTLCLTLRTAPSINSNKRHDIMQFREENKEKKNGVQRGMLRFYKHTKLDKVKFDRAYAVLMLEIPSLISDSD